MYSFRAFSIESTHTVKCLHRINYLHITLESMQYIGINIRMPTSRNQILRFLLFLLSGTWLSHDNSLKITQIEIQLYSNTEHMHIKILCKQAGNYKTTRIWNIYFSCFYLILPQEEINSFNRKNCLTSANTCAEIEL